MLSQKFIPALARSELVQGQMRCVDIDGVPVLLAHAKDGLVYAVHNVCTHAYAHMNEGRLRGHRLICPLHGASFDIRSGKVLGAPATEPLPSYAVRLTNEMIEVQVDP